jgi:hypothetical protein
MVAWGSTWPPWIRLRFQYVMFWFRYGWLLALVFVALFALQVRLTRDARAGSTS